MMPRLFKMKYMPLIVFQIILMALFFVFVRYHGSHGAGLKGFEDTHVMIFIGFGFLMTFLKKYCYSALGFNWFLAALVCQWALICQNVFSLENGHIYLTKHTIIEADIMAAAVLITFGAVLGVTSGPQLIFIAIVETVVGCVNMYLMTDIFKISDVGGSIGIHTFGAYFGIGVSLAYRRKSSPVGEGGSPNENNAPTYVSDVTAMIGSIFLYIYWPSFNSALTGSEAEYQRAVTNTYLSLAACTVMSFILSSAVSHHRDDKFDMVHIQNSTLAGGVAVGAVCNLYVQPGGAIAIGMGAAVVSVLGYRWLTPAMAKCGLLDTCGVHNLHGMPGVYSGLLSVLFAFLASEKEYGLAELHTIYPALSEGRTVQGQAIFQLLALVETLALSFVSGVITGFISKLKCFGPLQESEKYDDTPNWDLPSQSIVRLNPGQNEHV